jgi:hypothetical protein
MYPKRRWIFAMTLALGLLGGGCDNAFESFGDKNSTDAKLEEARTAMDQGNFATAVPLLETLHLQNPGDAEISRSLATAYSGRAGLNFFDLVARSQEAQGNGAIQDNTIAHLVNAFPHPVTDNNILDISRAIGMLDNVSASSGSPDDFYSLGLFYSAKAVLLILKDTDKVGNDGIPDTFTSTAMDNTDALTVYGSLDNALSNFGPGKAGLDGSSEVLKSLGDLKNEINASTGATIADKLRNYLASVF